MILEQEIANMRFDIQSRGFPLTEPLIEHTERRLQFALVRATERIDRIVVRLGDSNGQRGGEDKFCRVKVVLAHAPPVLIEDAGADLYSVIDRASERAGRNVARFLERKKEHIRSGKPTATRSPVDREFESPNE
jgi:putative sigma-54 modulation protein